MNGRFFSRITIFPNGKRYGTDFVGEENAMAKNGTGGPTDRKACADYQTGFFPPGEVIDLFSP